MNSDYKLTVGLEVHVELNTKSKMFCGCANDPHNSLANTHICPVCLAHPGTLPVPNEEAIAMVLLFGEAVKAKRADYSEFDRKNYFYPDIPKAYQISQYAFPFLTGGSLKGVELTRVHLEEDTARSQHDHEGKSLVDFNRAGVPLMELVTEPVIHDAETAVNFARELQLLLKTLKISDAQMERGEMRVEANISISKTDELGTKVEVKNLNSFKSVESAIIYEVARHKALLESGEKVIQETRGWDEVKLRTYSQRTKETAKDYRYFPDPDIPKISVSRNEYFSSSRLNEIMPELPSNKRLKYENLGLPSKQIEVIIGLRKLDEYFKTVFDKLNSSNPKAVVLAANYLTSDVLAIIGTNEETDIGMSPDSFSELMLMLEEGSVNSRIAKDLIKEFILVVDSDPKKVASDRGLLQSSDTGALKTVVDEVMTENPQVVLDIKDGKTNLIQFLIGQAMKKTKGSANPAVLTELFSEALK